MGNLVFQNEKMDGEWTDLDTVINMRQCCGHWKNSEKQFFVPKWSIFTKGEFLGKILVVLKGLNWQQSFHYRKNDKKVTLLLIYQISDF